MEGTLSLGRFAILLAASLIVMPAVPVSASPKGKVAAALVSEEIYRHYMDDMLFTHDGDDRFVFGADHDPARTNIVDLLTSYGLDVTLEPFDFQDGITLYNVVATKLGSTDSSVEYLIGAHFDSGDPFNGGTPGAVDNASGVALILAAARVLSVYDSDYTIRFIAFDAEEFGLIGSGAYADSHSTDDIRGMIAVDEVGWSGGDDEVRMVGRPASDPIKLAMADALTTYGEGLDPLDLGVLDGTDHAPFELQGFQACGVAGSSGNGTIHTPQDSVDTPGYVDYVMGTEITRAVVGFLVDHAGVQVPLPNGDFDGNGEVDQDDFDAFAACFAGAGNPPEPGCEFFDLDTDGDVDCVDADLLAAVWTGPDDPPPFWPCVQPSPTVDGSARCFLVTPPEHGLPMALLVTGDVGDANVACLFQYVQSGGGLSETPVFQMYDTWGTVEVCDEAVVGGEGYHVWCDYGEPGSPVMSDATFVITPMWGDAVGDFVGGQWTPADGTIDFNDITAVVDAFRVLPTAPPIFYVDLVGPAVTPCRPVGIIDFSDISAVVDAFRSISYWDSTGCSPPCE